MSSAVDSKRKAPSASNDANSDKKKKVKAAASTTTLTNGPADANNNFKLMSLVEIKDAIASLCLSVPTVPEGGLQPENVRTYAEGLQVAIEELNLLLCCISSSTYKWGSDRSGAGDQNLGLLSAELQNSQEQISAMVLPRITNILAPVVEVYLKTTEVVTGDGGKVVKTNEWVREVVDPDFLELCVKIMCRNAPMLRQGE
jgi:hypothetical protein